VPSMAGIAAANNVEEAAGGPVGRVCTLVNVSNWEPSAEAYNVLLGMISEKEKNRIKKFRFPIDAHRSLLGRLLIRDCVEENIGRHFPGVRKPVLTRTSHNKPIVNMLECANIVSQDKKRFNFNVSHHGSWVASTFHNSRIVGVDVMKYERPKGCKDLGEYFRLMKSSFLEKEWKLIRGSGNEKNQLVSFYRFWALKESYIKAVGVGLGLKLDRLEFFFDDGVQPHQATKAHARLDGQPLSSWEFVIFEPDEAHCIVVGTGPWEHADDEFGKHFPPFEKVHSDDQAQGQGQWEFLTVAAEDYASKVLNRGI
jgi:4'-phosphopantetheinyl transferase